MTVFDELSETDGDDKVKSWLSKLIDAKQEIVAFVASRRRGKPAGEFDRYRNGSFSLRLVVKFSDGEPKAVIRFPKPGHTATVFRDEKVRNEVQFLQFLKRTITIPILRVSGWELIEGSPQHLGPFIIMDLIDGISLATISKQQTETEQDEVMLANDVNNANLDHVYEQLADYFMNELKTVVSNYPISGYPTTSFTCAEAFLHSRTDEHLSLVSCYYVDHTGPFKPYCDHLHPLNMLANLDTLRITAILGSELANTIPAQFVYDRPWWQLLLGSDMWLENHSREDFMIHYEPRMVRFLRALKLVEKRKNAEETNSEESQSNELLSSPALQKDGDDTIRDEMGEEMGN
ncbi:hypothetical protein BKA66DRAFT_516286 [Pyrenochaeta sp. MPI-SDFR-AT-0127]|nr:hypothetical protein BKA66DRAFT_516286 [Pyrenochaeta sp. MPI-SDFR-AT-0127]